MLLLRGLHFTIPSSDNTYPNFRTQELRYCTTVVEAVKSRRIVSTLTCLLSPPPLKHPPNPLLGTVTPTKPTAR